MRSGLCGILISAALALPGLLDSRAAAEVALPALTLAPSAAPVDRPALPSVADSIRPQTLSVVDEPESVYPQILSEPNEGINAGAVHFSLDVSYLTRYVFRGVDQATLPGHSENSLQFNGEAEFDLGKIPHPFIGLFANVFNQDPVARFEEVRPVVGLRWTIKPLTLEGTYTAYLYPDRKDLDTHEGTLKLTLDDSRLWNHDTPLFSPYIFAAYDFELYYGVYLEFGIKHDFVIEETGITLTPSASIGYSLGDSYFRKPGSLSDSGPQHYELGLTLNYSLNHLLNIPHGFGRWNIRGYFFDDNGIDSDLRADTRLFGGGGIDFEY